MTMIQRCRRVHEGLDGAVRITAVHSAANFSYEVKPVVGDRFLCVGDAVAFVDPIFSSGVYVAMQSAELAAPAVLRAFGESRFEAARFAGYERRVRRGTGPFFRFISHYYDPSFLEVFLRPAQHGGRARRGPGRAGGRRVPARPLADAVLDGDILRHRPDEAVAAPAGGPPYRIAAGMVRFPANVRPSPGTTPWTIWDESARDCCRAATSSPCSASPSASPDSSRSARWPNGSAGSSRAATASCWGRSRWPARAWAWAPASRPAGCFAPRRSPSSRGCRASPPSSRRSCCRSGPRPRSS